MGHLHLALLGPPEVFHEGQRLKFRTRKALALLIYLAVEGGMHPREQVMTFFWSESDEQHSRTMLRTTLTYLRDALGDTAKPVHLSVERDSLSFDFTSDFDIDLHSFESVFHMARAHSSTKQAGSEMRTDLHAHLQRAARLYRGNFLGGFSLGDTSGFDDWARLQREVWHRRMTAVFDLLSQLQSDSGELSDAIESTTRWVTHDALNEDANLRLMQLHLEAGDRAAALQAYETYRSRLAEELRARPSPETEVLAERIRRGESQNRLLAHEREARTSGRGASSLAPPRSLPGIPLIGRASEYSTLIAMYRAAEEDGMQIAVIKGEAGIGKTRLATAFLARAAVHGADVLEGRAFESNSGLPYQPLVDALRRRVEQENAPEDLLSDTWLGELTRLLPELHDRYPDLPPSTTDEMTARLRLFEAIARLFQSLAERAPVVRGVAGSAWRAVAGRNRQGLGKDTCPFPFAFIPLEKRPEGKSASFLPPFNTATRLKG